MRVRFSSLLRSLVALAPAGLLAAACGGNVTVEKPPQCDDELVSCDGACVDTRTDPDNCGACGVACPDGECFDSYCGGIEPSCPPDLAYCDGDCVDIASDPENCGGCGIPCSFDAVCAGGTCQIGECLCGQVCDVVDLGSQVPQSAYETTDGKTNAINPSCAPSSGADVTFTFIAPYDGVFWFDTFGSSFDTALDVSSGGCEELGCNDDYAANGTSAVTVKIPGGQMVFVSVDTVTGGGSFQLNVHDYYNEPCETCATAIENVTPQGPVCPGSEGLYLALVGCACDGACAALCKDLCNGGEVATPECGDCAMSDAGCAKQFNDCANDL